MPAFGDVKAPLATVISEYCFLNCKLVVVTSRLAIFLRLTGVSKLFALTWKLDLRSKRSFTSREPGINHLKHHHYIHQKLM